MNEIIAGTEDALKSQIYLRYLVPNHKLALTKHEISASPNLIVSFRCFVITMLLRLFLSWLTKLKAKELPCFVKKDMFVRCFIARLWDV